MENSIGNLVYHGSAIEFGTVTPKLNTRISIQEGKEVITFQDISFHATPHKWIALAYTYERKELFEYEGRRIYYTISISLFTNNKTVNIHGINSLEESLLKLYGKGGYLYFYDSNDFFHTEGLGDLEVITQKEIDPVKVEYIKDPIEEMKKLGVRFVFVDLALPENARRRRYVSR